MISKFLNYNKEKQTGAILVVLMVVSLFFLIVFLGSISLALLHLKLNKQKIAQAQALYIAEAGVNYYRWLLYHDDKHYFTTVGCDYDIDCDIGTTTYDNPFDPSDSGIKGQYHLTVHTPKKNGSSVITLMSTGWTDEYPELKKTIEVKIGKRSWASYSILSNSNLNIFSGDEIYGPIHSNGGVRMDGTAYNLVTSSVKKYFDTEHCGAEEYGVHTHAVGEFGGGCACPTLPNSCNPDERYDDAQYVAGTMPQTFSTVFRAGRNFPVQPISFNTLSDSISEMMDLATSTDGTLISGSTDNCDAGSTCTEGFHIILNNNNYTLRGVTGVNCNGYGIASETDLGTVTYSYPANGVILVTDRDKLWIEGNVENNRVSILAFNGAIDAGNADIIISDDITYSNTDGSEALGLIAQRNIEVDECISNNNLIINASMITKKGKITADQIEPQKNSVSVYGSIASYSDFTLTGDKLIVNGCCNIFLPWPINACIDWIDCYMPSGFSNLVINYDTNLTYDPPPHFPTTGDYTFISWKEY